MHRWRRVARGMLAMGLTFSAGVALVGSTLALLVRLLPGRDPGLEMVRVVFACSLWAFLIGVAFSGVMAIVARGRPFEKLSLPLFAVLGAGAGLLFFGVLALNAWSAWSASTALLNAAIFVLLGSGSATATLLLARRSRPALGAGDEPRHLGDG